MFAPASYLPALVGYALLFNVPSNRRENGYRLQFDDGAFDDSLICFREQIFAVIEHDECSCKIASYARGTLLVDTDSVGLFVVILPRNDSYGRIATSLVAARHVGAMSAGVVCTRYERSGGIQRVTKARLEEVSGVPEPAIVGTSLQVASCGVPRTVEELLAEECRLLEENLRHTKAGTLLRWKIQKAARRAALLQSQPQLATAGCHNEKLSLLER